ncbi:MAG: hypothetical protein ACRD2D_09870 [Terriglobales bacterium]
MRGFELLDLRQGGVISGTIGILQSQLQFLGRHSLLDHLRPQGLGLGGILGRHRFGHFGHLLLHLRALGRKLPLLRGHRGL